MTVYFEDFSSWQDVAMNYVFGSSYNPSNEKLEESLRKIPEPDEVLYACYTYRNYDGESLVFFRNGDSYYLVQGGHCSCYGLEDQWNPEEYDKDTLEKLLKRIIENNLEKREYFGSLMKEAAPIVLGKLYDKSPSVPEPLDKDII